MQAIKSKLLIIILATIVALTVAYFTVNTKSQWAEISVAYDHVCGIYQSNQKLYCFGGNKYGQLGDGTNIDRKQATQIGSQQWHSISVGYNFSCGISKARELYCWGDGEKGKLGDNDPHFESKNSPVKIADGNWISLATGSNHACAINQQKQLYCWGYNLGEYSDGIRTSIPTLMGEATWQEIALGQGYSCGVQSSGQLICWGDNAYGQLGDGTNGYGANKYYMTQIGQDKWQHIYSYSRGQHSCGIKKSDQQLYCWGYNEDGQLGHSALKSTSKPMLSHNNDWQEVTLDVSRSCALDSSNKLYCWGWGSGQPQLQPVLNNEYRWQRVSAGGNRICGVKLEDGQLYCWDESQSPLEGKIVVTSKQSI